MKAAAAQLDARPYQLPIMPELTLLPLDRETAERFAREPTSCADEYGLVLAPHESTVVAIAAATAQMLATRPTPMPWGGYLALDGAARRVVGTCGFKGGPDSTSTVELAYFTFPGEEGRGIASAMVSALVHVARSADPAVVTLCAHTLPERNASCRVLEKSGFQYAGGVTDPEDGPVWRWSRPTDGTV